MRYHQIRKMDISDGPGIRVSIFMQGCTFHCKNCFNPETHDFEGGLEFTEEAIEKVIALAAPDYIAGLSILGGEPMHMKNREGTLALAKRFKEIYPHKTVWVWSGFLFEDLKDNMDLKNIDVLVDGRYQDELHHPNIKWRGSTNQRVIDIGKSLKKKQIVLFEGE